MKTFLYIIALILVIGWILGFYVFSLGYLIHALLVLAVISVLLSLIKGDLRSGSPTTDDRFSWYLKPDTLS